MYTLYLDESGTHGSSPVFILAGIAIHEQDMWHLKRRVERALVAALPAGLDPDAFELHAAEMKTPRSHAGRPSPWHGVPYPTRMRILEDVYVAIASYRSQDASRPIAMFGAVVDRVRYQDYEQRAYEEVLHKFDEMLTRQGHSSGVHERGIVIHDRRVIERDVQAWANRWRHVAGRMGVLNHMGEVPLFADSRASRLIQCSDFVSWALWRHYGLPTPDQRWISMLWSQFDTHSGVMHGLIHVTPNFRSGCTCRPCSSRRIIAPTLPSIEATSN